MYPKELQTCAGLPQGVFQSRSSDFSEGTISSTMTGDALALFPELLLRDSDPLNKGILPVQRLEELVRNGNIRASTPILGDQIQPSSIDLRLSKIAYRVSASFLPTQNATVQQKLQELLIEEVDLLVQLCPKKALSISSRFRRVVSSGFYLRNGQKTNWRLDIFSRLLSICSLRMSDQATKANYTLRCPANIRHSCARGSAESTPAKSWRASFFRHHAERNARTRIDCLFPRCLAAQAYDRGGLQLSINLEGRMVRPSWAIGP
jgi:hypothetical protein